MSLVAISYPRLRQADFDFIQSIRQEHEPNFELLGPHVTLVFPTEGIGESELLDHVRPILEATPAIDFVMRSVSLVKEVDGERWFLLLTPDEGYSEIVGLHDRLYVGILAAQLRRDIPFIPHITMAVFSEWEAGCRLRDRLNGRQLEIAGRLDSVEIADYLPERLTTVTTIRLQES